MSSASVVSEGPCLRPFRKNAPQKEVCVEKGRKKLFGTLAASTSPVGSCKAQKAATEVAIMNTQTTSHTDIVLLLFQLLLLFVHVALIHV